jgi:hypothetical protein
VIFWQQPQEPTWQHFCYQIAATHKRKKTINTQESKVKTKMMMSSNNGHNNNDNNNGNINGSINSNNGNNLNGNGSNNNNVFDDHEFDKRRRFRSMATMEVRDKVLGLLSDKLYLLEDYHTVAIRKTPS